jgi:branched-chain amino acid transport system substrate-binding protein
MPDSGSGDRRSFLKAIPALSIAGLAGCSVQSENSGGDGGGGGSGDGGDGGGGGDGSDGGSSGGTTTGSVDEGLDEVVLGNPTNQTARFSWVQASADLAYDIAIQEANDAGGPLGAEVTNIRRDTALNPSQARQVTTQFIESDDAVAITGLGSGEITTNWDWIQDQNVPVCTGVAGTHFLNTRGGDKGTPGDLSDDEWVWRTVPGDGLSSLAAASKLYDDGNRTLGIYHGTDPTTIQPADSLQAVFEDLGGEVVQRIELQQDKSTYQAELNRMPWDEVDAFAIIFTLDGTIVFLQDWLQSDGTDTTGYLHEAVFNEKFFGEMGSNLVDKDTFTLSAFPGNPRQAALEEKFKSQYDKEWLPLFCPSFYDKANVVLLALHASGETGSIEAQREAIQRNVRSVATGEGTTVTTFGEGKEALDNGEAINYQGAASTADFTSNGNIYTPVGVFDIAESGFERTSLLPEDQLREMIGDEY